MYSHVADFKYMTNEQLFEVISEEMRKAAKLSYYDEEAFVIYHKILLEAKFRIESEIRNAKKRIEGAKELKKLINRKTI